MISNELRMPLEPDRKTVRLLWKIGGAVALFLVTLVVAGVFQPAERRVSAREMGHDFLAFYTAGSLVREGRVHEVYRLPALKARQNEIAAGAGIVLGENYGPFWNPPFYAWVFVPLAGLPFWTALVVWEVVCAACLAGAVWMLVRMLPPGWRVQGLVPLGICTSMPFVQAVTHGQNTMTSLLLLCGVVTLWRAERAVWAGVVAGLMFYKPQLGAVVACALVACCGWRAVVGIGITGVVLLGLTVWSMPGVLGDYQRWMPGNLRHFQTEAVYIWDRHVTLTAFWRMLIQGRGVGEMWGVTRALGVVSSAAVVAGLGWAWWQWRRSGRSGRDRDLLIAAVVVGMPAVMPFYLDYDLLLLAVPAVLCAASGAVSGRAAVGLWVGLFFWLMVNSAVARWTGFGGAAVLLCGLVAVLVRRVGRVEAVAVGDFDQRPLATAA